MRTDQTNPSQEGTSTGTTNMDVDQDLPEGTTPPPWHALRRRLAAYQQRGASCVDPSVGVHTRSFFTFLYTKSQEIDHTTADTGHQTPQPPSGRLDTINEAEEEELAATVATEAKAHRTTEL